MKHTPTPWFVDDIAVGSIESASGIVVAQAQMVKPAREDLEQVERRANAEFIVRAVNSHDALVAAVRSFIEYDSSNESDGVTMMIAYNDALEACRLALATVEKP